MEQKSNDLSIEEKKAQFRKAAITHRLLERTDRTIMRAIREPAGFAFLLVHGPTGVGKTKMIEILTERIRGPVPSPHALPFASLFHQTEALQIPLLVIEARPPDGSAFNRAYYSRTLLSLMGERTYPQQIHIDIHAGTDLPKRRPMRGKAAQFNDLPELREAAEEAMRRHGVQVIIVDEAHHMLYTSNGGPTVTLQDQLEWLKSMSNTTHVLHILVGTYDLLNFGHLNGQISRRCLPVHFARYQLQREEDCIEFQATLLALLQKVPLNCDAATFVGSYWLYFYECSIGCIGVLKDWLLRAVSTALDEGQDTLTLDWLQDHAPPVDTYRQMALDATEGEQKLNHTASNREHVWRLLQGGELIAPVPPLLPRGTPPKPSPLNVSGATPHEDAISPPPPSPAAVDAASAPPVKKTRSRKKVAVPPQELEQGIVIQVEPGAESSPDPPRRRRKKTEAKVLEDPELSVNVLSEDSGEASSGLIDVGEAVSPTKPKRIRRVGEPKPQRYPVGQREAEWGHEEKERHGAHPSGSRKPRHPKICDDQAKRFFGDYPLPGSDQRTFSFGCITQAKEDSSMSTEQDDRSCNLEQQARAEMPLLDEQATAAALPAITMAKARTLLDLSPDALVMIDSAGSIVLVNEQAATLFGYGHQELDGQPLEVLLPERFHAAHVAHRRTYVTMPRPRPMGVGLDLVGRRKDGSEFPVDISLRPVFLKQALHMVGAIRDVTAQRLLERERMRLAEHLALQSTLINLAHDAILVRDPISRVLSWNQGAEELYGWTEKEALGRVSHILLKTRFPVSRAAVDAQVEREGHWEGELVHSRRDGHVVVVESRQVLIRDARGAATAIVEINRDITQRRKLEQAQTTIHIETLAQRTFLQELLDALPTSVYVVHGHDARLVLANRAGASIWGAVWPPGQPMHEFLEEHHIRIVNAQGRTFPPETWATMRALQDGETVLQHQEVIHQPSGTNLPILVNAVPLTSPHWRSLGGPEHPAGVKPIRNGEPLALVIHQDVHTLKEAEYFKDEFIGIAAHELRQPLAVLKAAVGTLVLQTARGHGTPLAAWQQEMLQDLEQATDRLVTLTDDLLDVSRLQAGQLLLQRASTNLVSLIQRLVERFQKTTTRHQLAFHPEHPTLEATIDRRRIEQVLSNLLTNAIKYSPQGGPIAVTVGKDVADHAVEIRVQDSGMGIPPHQQARIFGRFMRADNAQAAGISGTGLGLYLCRALVEQHAGRLWFESEEGEGTTFFVTIPLVAPDRVT